MNMAAGLIADIVVAVLIIINLIICTKVGLIRCVLKCISTIVSLALAILFATTLAKFLDGQFDLVAKIETWNVPFISAGTMLSLFCGVAIFVFARLVCILIDRLLSGLKEKLKAVNALDRILGTVFGFFAALVELTLIFMLIESFGLVETLSLTADAGGYFAYRLYDFCHEYLFAFLSEVFAAAADMTPKV